MKKVWDKVSSPSNIRYLVYVITIFVLLHLGSVFSSHMETRFVRQRILNSFSDNAGLTIAPIASTEDDGVLLGISDNDKQVISYAHPFRISIRGQLVEGWDLFSKDFQYQDFRIVYWENNEELKLLLDTKDLRKGIVERKMELAQGNFLYFPLFFSNLGKRDDEILRDINSFVESRLNSAFGIPEQFSAYLFESGDR